MLRITIYSRPNCHLCEDAISAIQQLSNEIEINEVDVDSDPDLRRRYGYDIPVAVASGKELFRHRFDRAAVQTAIDNPEQQ